MDLLSASNICTAVHPTAMTTGFFVLLGAGLLTGLSHCVGMCGPLVGAFAVRRRAARQEVSTSLVLFQTGRLTTYVLLGLLMGSAGYVLASAIRNWQGLLSAALGLFVMVLGLSLLGLLPFQRWIASTKLASLAGGWIKRLMNSNHPAAPFGLGLANGLLPCGPVYAMALLAATSSDPLRGAGVMLIFGLGTLPAMLGIGFSTSLLSVRLRSHLYRVAAILVVIVGLQLTMRGLALGGQITHGAIGGVMLW
jgi:sulfite exporter TauE/SafE